MTGGVPDHMTIYGEAQNTKPSDELHFTAEK